MKNAKHIYPRIGQPIICPSCEGDRRFGYGPCSNCGHQPNKAAVDAIRETGIWIDPDTGAIAARASAGKVDAAERDWEQRYMGTEPQDEGG